MKTPKAFIPAYLIFCYLYRAHLWRWSPINANAAYEMLSIFKVASGSLPLRDFTSMYGPLGSILYAIPFHFIPEINVLVLLNLLILFGCVYLMYRAMRPFNQPFATGLVLLYWVVTAVFQPGNSYFLLHSFAGTWGQLILLVILNVIMDSRDGITGKSLAFLFASLILIWGGKYEQIATAYVISFTFLISLRVRFKDERPLALGLIFVFMQLLYLIALGPDLFYGGILQIIIDRVNTHSISNGMLGLTKAYALFLVYRGSLEIEDRALSGVILFLISVFTFELLYFSNGYDVVYFSYVFVQVVCIHGLLSVAFREDKTPLGWSAFMVLIMANLCFLRSFREGFHYAPSIMAIGLLAVFVYSLQFEITHPFLASLPIIIMSGFLFFHIEKGYWDRPSFQVETKWGTLCVADSPRERLRAAYSGYLGRGLKENENLFVAPNPEGYLMAGKLPVTKNFMPYSITWALTKFYIRHHEVSLEEDYVVSDIKNNNVKAFAIDTKDEAEAIYDGSGTNFSKVRFGEEYGGFILNYISNKYRRVNVKEGVVLFK